MPSTQTPIHNSPSRARDEQTVIASGVKAEAPEKNASENHPGTEPASPAAERNQNRKMIAFLSVVALAAVLAALYAWTATP